jgi:2-(1,2-epoxy-1,2-dihydrophenyl)acetyl-CoA isomerase
MALALVYAIARAGADPSVRVVIVRGCGPAFCAGGDVKQMAEDAAEGRTAAYFNRPLAAIHAAAVAVRNLEKPVIAGLHGAVAGAGLNLALGCDYRVAADDVRLVQAFTNIGLGLTPEERTCSPASWASARADSTDVIEGVRAVVGRREPRFEGR